MLCSIKHIHNAIIAARDGDIGHVREVLFDDAHWVIRHIVVDSGGWLSGRRVLISPHAVERIDAEHKRLVVALTKQQIEDAPDIDTDKPVSRQHETALYDYYGYPYWWAGAGIWGAAAYPMAGASLAVPRPAPDDEVTRELRERQQAERDAADPRLRSSAEVSGYRIEAKDGSIGHIEDFLFDDGQKDKKTWRLKRVGKGRYEGAREDVVGIAKGYQDGPAFRLEYDIRLPKKDGTPGRKVRFRDVMVLTAGDVVINNATIGYFGLHVGGVNLKITPVKSAN